MTCAPTNGEILWLWLSVNSELPHYRRRTITITPIAVVIGFIQHWHSNQELFIVSVRRFRQSKFGFWRHRITMILIVSSSKTRCSSLISFRKGVIFVLIFCLGLTLISTEVHHHQEWYKQKSRSAGSWGWINQQYTLSQWSFSL